MSRDRTTPAVCRLQFIYDDPAQTLPAVTEIPIDLNNDTGVPPLETGFFWLARKWMGRGDHAFICFADTRGFGTRTQVLLDVAFMPSVDMSGGDWDNWNYRDLVAWLCEVTGHFLFFSTRTVLGGKSHVKLVVRSRQPGIPLYTLTEFDLLDDVYVTGPEHTRVILTSHGTTYRKGSELKTARELVISNDGVPATIAEDVAEWLAFVVFGAYQYRVNATGDFTLWVECGDYVEVALHDKLIQGIVVRAANQMQEGRWGSVAIEVFGQRLGVGGLDLEERYQPRQLEAL
jgi:hypothetical protein